MNEYFRIGVIVNTHGLKGEVKAFPTTDDISRFEYLDEVLIETSNGYKAYHVTSVKYIKNLVVLKLTGIESVEEAERNKGRDLMVSRENAIPLEEGEYYVADLIGLPVFDEAGNVIGKLKEVLETGANNVYIVGRAGKRDLLLPAIPDCIKSVDPEGGRIVVHVLDGLEDL